MTAPPLGLDPGRLADHLETAPPGAGPVTVKPVSGGCSNPSFFMGVGGERDVLRKQPPGGLLPSAHAIDREFRVLSALPCIAVPVPAALRYCADASVIGSLFYVMERLDDRVFHDNALPGLPPRRRTAMFEAMNATLAALRQLNLDAPGLRDYSRTGGSFARQIARWTRQYEAAKTREIAEIPELAKWLAAHLHGGYRLGNLFFRPSRPEILGVLDWELSTLGHPMSDLDYNPMQGPCSPANRPGWSGWPFWPGAIWPSWASRPCAYTASYFAHRGLPDGCHPFYTAFAFFRLAVIFEGNIRRVWARHRLTLVGDGNGL